METALLIWFSSYLAIIISKFGVTDSISRTWYSWKEESNSRMFTIFCYGLGIGLMIFAGTHGIKIPTHLLLIGGAFSIGCVGIASNYKDLEPTRVDIIHYVFSGLTIGCCLIALWVELSWLFAGAFTLITVAILVLKYKRKLNNAIFWIEVAAFYIIVTGLYAI